MEAACVLLAVGAAYFLLLSQIPVHDVARYVGELESDQFHWDLGHVWMQPLALLIHRVLRPFVGVMRTLEMVNVTAVALGTAIFYAMLRRLGQSVPRALVASVFVCASYGIIVLGPSGHIKLTVFPTLALSLGYAVLWEQRAAQGELRWQLAALSGLWLGIGANFLVSIVPAGPFVCAFMLWRSRQAGARKLAILGSSFAFGIALLAGWLALLCAAYATAQATGTTDATSLSSFLFDGMRKKEALHVGFSSFVEVPFRFLYSLAFNFVFMPTLGALGRAWLAKMLPEGLGGNAWPLAWQFAVFLLSLATIGAIVWVALRSWGRRNQPLLMGLGFVCGAAAFSLYYNLNDTEHWIQFTLPIALLAVQARRKWLDRLTFGVWLPVLAAINLGLYGVPKALFDMPTRQAQLTEALGPSGLGIGFAGYPGEPDSSLVGSGTATRFRIDVDLEKVSNGKVDVMLDHLDAEIDAAFARGGRVLVFRALDPNDWRGPVFVVALEGVTKTSLRTHLARRYRISGPIEVAGFPAWELTRPAP
jgi:hypothetical protein